MAAQEMYDYLSSASADNDQTLNVTPTDVSVEIYKKNQVIHMADDNSEERISFSDDSIVYATLVWDDISESEAGTIVQFYNDAGYGNGIAESFKWSHPTDGHVYVVRFASELSRERKPLDVYGIREVHLRVLGYIS